MLWLSADLRDEWRKLDGIERCLRDGATVETIIAANGRSATGSLPRTATPVER
jgi:hypothetical protein